MNYIADLHIHSRFSMASSRTLTLAELSQWGMRKGISLLATGDFTHPAWQAELRDHLEFLPDQSLYGLKRQPQPADGIFPGTRPPLFCLEAEISCIYKKRGKTRKIHNLVYMPDLEKAARFSGKLANYGKLHSDGRPTVSLSSRDLLEMALETSDRAVVIPAHIWTPWFGLFGSKSGFDSLEECYEDLSNHIFALETGLSSDPPMNRLLSSLDKYALLSNSDAHSGVNLGREANFFSGELQYDAMFASLKEQGQRKQPDSTNAFLGTMEFFPQEGKYHLDGHRKCQISLTPAESRTLNDICPICGKPMTIGVMHRVTDLADRARTPNLPYEPETRRMLSLAEVTAQILKSSQRSKAVQNKCASIRTSLGPELEVLCLKPVDEIRAWWAPLGEAVARIRSGHVTIKAGYDGEYGKITIFEPGELH